MNTEDEMDKFLIKLFLWFSELTIIIPMSIITILSGVIVIYIKRHINSILNRLGITYFAERNKIIREINSDLVWCQGALQAEIYGLFRTYNTNPYVVDINDRSIVIRKSNSKPEEMFGDFLNVKLFRSIIELSITNDWKLISYAYLKEEKKDSPLLVFLEQNNIDYLMSYRIWDLDKKTYGIILFSWSYEPDVNTLFTPKVSKKLDSVSIRYQNYISSSILEKIGIRKLP